MTRITNNVNTRKCHLTSVPSKYEFLKQFTFSQQPKRYQSIQLNQSNYPSHLRVRQQEELPPVCTIRTRALPLYIKLCLNCRRQWESYNRRLRRGYTLWHLYRWAINHRQVEHDRRSALKHCIYRSASAKEFRSSQPYLKVHACRPPLFPSLSRFIRRNAHRNRSMPQRSPLAIPSISSREFPRRSRRNVR